MTENTQIGSPEILIRLATCIADHIRSKDQTDPAHQTLATAMADHLDRIGSSKSKLGRPSPRIVRGLRHAPTVFAQPCVHGLSALTQAALAAFGHVNWSEFYAEDDWSRPFLKDFANGEGVGPDGVLIRNDVILGLFIMGPNTLYPAHAHPASEFYIVISGEAEFQVGADFPYILRAPGDLILHRENEAHSIRTRDKPLFAVFGWSGAISEASWYSDDMTSSSATVRHPTIAKA